jgi:hypothetical protein
MPEGDPGRIDLTVEMLDDFHGDIRRHMVEVDDQNEERQAREAYLIAFDEQRFATKKAQEAGPIDAYDVVFALAKTAFKAAKIPYDIAKKFH